ncbi:MAG: DNA topoisomerase IB [Sphingomicrobium sp.]
MLRHCTDSQAGYSRKRSGDSWHYFDEHDEQITDAETIDRLNRIALPPAYVDAWFSKYENGHIQATGKDARGRKQYRYHPDYRSKRDASKFDGCYDFGKSLGKLRLRVEKDLRRRKLARETVLAAVVRLLDNAYFRVGNEQYAKSNKSFGATTLRNRHVRKKGRSVVMRFAGKHGIIHEHTITDRSLGRIVRQCQDLPGQSLFQYVNGDGEPHSISSSDVNDYIRDATGGDFTAKHFRTWGASVIAFEQLMNKPEDEKIGIQTVLEPVAEALGNTPAISRKSYIHPAVIDAVKDDPDDPLAGLKLPRAGRRLSPAESGLIAFLKPKSRKRRKAATG